MDSTLVSIMSSKNVLHSTVQEKAFKKTCHPPSSFRNCNEQFDATEIGMVARKFRWFVSRAR